MNKNLEFLRQFHFIFVVAGLIVAEMALANPNSPQSLLSLSIQAARKKILADHIDPTGNELQSYQTYLQENPTINLKVVRAIESLEIPKELQEKIFDRKIYIETGDSHSLFLTEEGHLFSFGFGIAAQLGHGTYENQFIPKKVSTEFLKGQRIQQIAAGRYHTLLLTDQGSVYSFGEGTDGRLGHGDEKSQIIPKLIESDLLEGQRVTQIAVANYHCLLLTEEGRVFTFGYGLNGQLGYGIQRKQLSPRPVDGANWEGHRIVRVAAGDFQSFLLTDEGGVLSFGSGAYGHLGHGDTLNQLIPKLIQTSSLKGQKIIQIAVGKTHCLLLSDQGRVFSFGDGSKGQLGHGDFINQVAPKPIEAEILKNLKIVQVAAGHSLSLLLAEDGTVLVFGGGDQGWLREENLNDISIPKLMNLSSLRGQKVIRIAMGNTHTLLLSESGSVFSFGSGSNGQLGLGKTVLTQSSPKEVNLDWLWSPQEYGLFPFGKETQSESDD
jgi:alpha-tubulin suppressor-like RCC1 family protein